MATNTDIIKDATALVGNPLAIQRAIGRRLSQATNGLVVSLDPTLPAAFLLEAAVSLAAAGMIQSEVLNRKQYPSTANTFDELYYHMTDSDYIDRFSTPAETTMTLLLGLADLRRLAVDDGTGTGTSKLVIPRHTEFLVGGTAYTMQYPIVVEVKPHGGIGVTYDNTYPSPFYLPVNSQLGWSGVVFEGLEFLKIIIPVKQMKLTQQFVKVDATTGFSKRFPFTDRFFHCRAYMLNSQGRYIEILTTHSSQVYDPTKPTIVLKVLNSELKVSIPQIYFNQGLIIDSIRIDIYTTKGPLDIHLANYAVGSYSARWIDNDVPVGNPYSTPLNTFPTAVIYSDDIVTGGSVGMSFAELREQVITRGQATAGLPITPIQAKSALKKLGYDLVVGVDNITARQFLATRELPLPDTVDVNGQPITAVTVTPIGAVVGMLQASAADLTLLQHVNDHRARMTLTPKVLYRFDNGLLKVIGDTELNSLKSTALTADGLCSLVNKDKFVYTPFHHVLDLNGDRFNVRPYRLDSPDILNKYFFQANSTAQIDVSTTGSDLIYGDNGYTLGIELTGDATFNLLGVNRIGVQLSYAIPTTTLRGVINGRLATAVDPSTGLAVNDRYVYHFDLGTTFDVDTAHRLILNPSGHAIDLTTQFDIVVIIKDHLPEGAVYSDIDAVAVPNQLLGYNPTSTYIGISQEKIEIRFGQYLEHLWYRGRTVVGETEYARYSSNVMAYYPANVLVVDVNGLVVLTFNPATDRFDHTVLHHRGDPVLDQYGQQVIQHRKGDVIHDSFGKPVVVNGDRGVKRQVDLTLLDGRYYFATDTLTQRYVTKVVDTIENWAVDDLEAISGNLIDRTELFYYPRATFGEIEVTVGDGSTAYVNAEQVFDVTYYVGRATLNNGELKKAIIQSTIKTLNSAMGNTTISVDRISNTLKMVLGDDILAVDVRGFMGNAYRAVTISDSAKRPNIAKRLVVLSNLTLQVQDNVTVNFEVMD